MKRLELQECREVDNGVVESTGGTTGRDIRRDDTDGYMVTSGISVGEIPEWCRVDRDRQWWKMPVQDYRSVDNRHEDLEYKW